MMNAECRMRKLAVAATGVLGLSMLVHGCRTSSPPPPAAAAEAHADARPVKGRAQLWAENCQRCHNARPASWYSEREWEVAMHHMFVRGYLTRHEHDSVMEFFRASR